MEVGGGERDLAMVHPGSTCVEQLELVVDGLQLSVCTLSLSKPVFICIQITLVSLDSK